MRQRLECGFEVNYPLSFSPSLSPLSHSVHKGAEILSSARCPISHAGDRHLIDRIQTLLRGNRIIASVHFISKKFILEENSWRKVAFCVKKTNLAHFTKHWKIFSQLAFSIKIQFEIKLIEKSKKIKFSSPIYLINLCIYLLINL